MKRALVVLFLLLLVGAAVAKLFLLEIPVVGGNDMAPSLQAGDRLLAFCAGIKPKRGDLVLMEHPEGKWPLLRRVVGLPGERVAVKGEVPIVNGRQARREARGKVVLSDRIDGQEKEISMLLLEEVVDRASYLVLKDPSRRSLDTEELSLTGSYFVLADNRNHGTDSRTFGPVPEEKIRGIVTYRLSAGPDSLKGLAARSGFQKIP